MILDPELSSRYWLVRKVCALVGYYGGLRNIEMRSIEFGKTLEGGEKSFEVDQSGYWFCFERGKQRGLPETSVFCVPRRQADWLPVATSSTHSPQDFCPASVIDRYLEILESDLQTTRDLLTGSFFKSTHGKSGKRFRNVPMGKNILAKVGFEFAEELLLQHPHCFTGHCWRRSCGTNASDAGVNVTTLMAQLGWSTPKTAIGYVRKSRITSFQMSMFLSNCQRQNKDPDSCLSSARPVVVRRDQTVGCSSKSRLTKASGPPVPRRNRNGALCVEKLVPVVDANLSDKFAGHLAAAKSSEFVPRNAEHKKREIVRKRLLDQISGKVSPVRQATFGDVDREISHLGGDGEVDEASSGSVGGGRGGGDSSESSARDFVDRSVVESRVSSVVDGLRHQDLSSLRQQGDLHLHFHFGK